MAPICLGHNVSDFLLYGVSEAFVRSKADASDPERARCAGFSMPCIPRRCAPLPPSFEVQ